MKRMISRCASALPLAVIGGLFYAALFIKPQAVGTSVTPPAIERRDSFFDLAMPAPGVLWAVGSYGKVLKSEDGGKRWSVQSTPVHTHLQGIAVWDTKRAAAVGNDGVILTTADGGTNWAQVQAPKSNIANKLLRIRAFPEGLAWAVGVMGTVLRTKDFGAHWERALPDQDLAWNDIAFIGKRGWLVGEFGRIMRTDDGGETWRDIKSDLKRTLTSVAFRDDQNGVAVGLEGRLIVTSDGGQTWIVVPPITSEHLFAVTWSQAKWKDGNGTHWEAVGDKGVILESDAQAQQWSVKRISDRDLAWHTSVTGDGRDIWVAGGNLGVIQNGKFSAFTSR